VNHRKNASLNYFVNRGARSRAASLNKEKAANLLVSTIYSWSNHTWSNKPLTDPIEVRNSSSWIQEKTHTHTQPNNKRKPRKSKIEIQSNSDLQSNSGIPAQPKKQKHPTKQNKSRAQIFNLQGKFSRSVPAAADPLLFFSQVTTPKISLVAYHAWVDYYSCNLETPRWSAAAMAPTYCVCWFLPAQPLPVAYYSDSINYPLITHTHSAEFHKNTSQDFSKLIRQVHN
jgi:hypothetical protein